MGFVDRKSTPVGEIPGLRPLVVDLEGTLIRTDLVVESIFRLLKHNILFLFVLPFWFLKGKARLKHEIAARVDINVALLPFHKEFLDFLRAEHASGRRLALLTSSNRKFAEEIALHLGIFHDVLASDATVNLSEKRKLEQLKAHFGENAFDYAANAKTDIPLWAVAHSALLVNPKRGVKEAAERHTQIQRIFDDRVGSPLKHYLAALRLHHWLKNLLIFVPLVMAHRIGEIRLLGEALLAFLAFGLCASAVYLLNDLLDLQDDRQHPLKRNRPFAAGSISITRGVYLAPGLLMAAVAVAIMLPIEFAGLLALYFMITLAYSLRLKRTAVVDVLTLAGLYTIRIIAGGVAVSVRVSFWLLAFSMFLFLSLALVKRFTELLKVQQQGGTTSLGRDYSETDLETLSQFGSASAYMSVLVLALYIESDAVRNLYTHPEVIWLLCPILLYLVMRTWLVARRDQLHEDPLMFIIRDRRSQILLGVGAILLWLAV